MITFHVWLHGVELPMGTSVQKVTGLNTFLFRAKNLQETQANNANGGGASAITFHWVIMHTYGAPAFMGLL